VIRIGSDGLRIVIQAGARVVPQYHKFLRVIPVGASSATIQNCTIVVSVLGQSFSLPPAVFLCGGFVLSVIAWELAKYITWKIIRQLPSAYRQLQALYLALVKAVRKMWGSPDGDLDGGPCAGTAMFR
jgi:hypothetical protein